ncbi:hypothetical protein [Kitasatospora sp. NPDC127116]|uniref:hypothetical protein n=1 Tax=Kitasatospora sp. NPDC127116 TaxID=3345367 RepID=UPI00362D40E7
MSTSTEPTDPGTGSGGTPTDPPPTGPVAEPTPDGQTWYPRELVEAQGWWHPADPAHMDPTWPAWKLPAWYSGRTGALGVPGPPGLPGTSQFVFGGWLPWQAGAERYDAAKEWPAAVRLTIHDMQADLGLLPPAPAPVEPPPVQQPAAQDDPDPASPPFTPPTLGQPAETDPEGTI